MSVLTHAVVSNSSRLVDIQTTEGAATVFLLPAYNDCGQYYFTGKESSLLVTVTGDRDAAVSRNYIRRSTIRYHDNHTLTFNLHGTSWRDEGTYTVKPAGPGQPADCRRVYTLTLRQDSGLAFWQNWGAWSTCDVSCGPGTSIRTRECSRPVACHHGDQRQVTRCMGEEGCPQWSWTIWGLWVSCDVTCGTGQQSRRRHCTDGVSMQPEDHCPGPEVDTVTCRVQDCYGLPESIATEGESAQGSPGGVYVSVPVSAMIGGGAGVVILVLATVISALLCRLHRRRRSSVNVTAVYSPHQQTLKITDMNRKVSAISGTDLSGTHVYEDIDERSSSCNEYLALPPASPCGHNPAPLYHNTSQALYHNISCNANIQQSLYHNTSSGRTKPESLYQN